MQCKSLDVCRGKMSLCAFTIMCTVHASSGFFFPTSVHLGVFKGWREQLKQRQHVFALGSWILFESHCEIHEKMRDTVTLEKLPSEQTLKTTAPGCPITHLYRFC